MIDFIIIQQRAINQFLRSYLPTLCFWAGTLNNLTLPSSLSFFLIHSLVASFNMLRYSPLSSQIYARPHERSLLSIPRHVLSTSCTLIFSTNTLQNTCVPSATLQLLCKLCVQIKHLYCKQAALGRTKVTFCALKAQNILIRGSYHRSHRLLSQHLSYTSHPFCRTCN